MALNTRAARKIATRAKVLAAARICFETLGYERATVRDIAKTAGLSTGAVFMNWPDKAALYREIYGHAPVSPEQGRALLEALQAVMPSTLIGENYATPVPDGEVLREYFFTWGKLRRARAAIAAVVPAAVVAQAA